VYRLGQLELRAGRGVSRRLLDRHGVLDARRPERTMMSASRALRDGVVDTWAAAVEAVAAEPR